MTEKENKMNKAIEHTQLEGMVFFHKEDLRTLLFSPNDPIPGITECFRSRGVAQQMSDGTFEFTEQPQKKPQSELIKKLAHGRVSKTKDGAIQLTLKVYCSEGVNIAEAIFDEACFAKEAIEKHLLKG